MSAPGRGRHAPDLRLVAPALAAWAAAAVAVGLPLRARLLLAAAASVHGYTTAFYFSTALFLIGLLVATLLLPRGVQPERHPAGEPAAEMA